MKWSFASTDAAASRAARKAFTAYLREQASPDSDILSAELTFGELVGNAARHAPGPVEVAVEWKNGRAALSVHDEGPGFQPTCTPPKDTFAESGRGLYIVARLASDLRVEDIARDGTRVSVVLPVRRGTFVEN
ncbi:MAG: ATP-binding protein [Candidatus Eremiobacteraeota bacterium]|nr:ATP-binding protein [Candidatus Eremiobacteraeota bacterium]